MERLNDLQKTLLEMINELNDFCEAKHLRYFTLGGTTLGCLRHQGFIPWDDDIDIGMPRTDFNELCRLWPSAPLKGKYIIETPASKDDNYCYPYVKVYDTTTTLIEHTQLPLKRGVYIDIFPLDGLGMSYDESRKNYWKIQKRREILQLRLTKADKNRVWYKNAVLLATQALPRFLISEKKICAEIVRLCAMNDFDTEEWGGNLVGAWGFREVMPRSVFGAPTRYKFEDIYLYGPEKAEEYLTRQYGDWRTEPPLEKQVSHHDFYLDLEHGYL